MLRAVVVLLIVTLLPSAAHADRFALVIGNQAYNDKVGSLRNPHNDIAVVGKALAEVGFKVLSPRKDATRDDILFAVHELAAQVRSAGRDAVSFLYSAGHGVGVGAENVLIPTNAENTTDAMLSVRGVRLGEILDILKREAPDAVHFVVLDACRNNLRGQRGSRGFVPVNDRRTGVVIAFSTAQGETATDDGATSAPYAAALAEEIVKPGRNDQAVFNAVRARVVSAAGGQTPWTHDGLVGERVVFKAATPGAPAPAAGSPPPAPARQSEAAEAWASVKDSTDVRDLEAYRRQYGQLNPFYDRQAERRIEELKKQTVAAAPPPATKPALAPLVETVVGLLSPSRAPRPLTPAEEGVLKPKDSFKECDDCPEMVVVPAGNFTMGSPASEAGPDGDEGPQHKVTIARPLAVGKFEVTFAEWEGCVAGGGCVGNKSPSDAGWGNGRRPVINVSWGDAKEYVAWLSRQTGKPYRLLSEAEWEYAARAGTSTTYSWGNEIGLNRANCEGCGSQLDNKQTAPVGSFSANVFGLHDMHGNVWEWVEDCWHGFYQGAPTDGSAWTTSCKDSRNRVLRGGSWGLYPSYLRAARRVRNSAGVRLTDLGFRLARTLD